MSPLLEDAARRAGNDLEGIAARAVAPSSMAVERLRTLDEPFPEHPCDPHAILQRPDAIGSPATAAMAMAGARFFAVVTVATDDRGACGRTACRRSRGRRSCARRRATSTQARATRSTCWPGKPAPPMRGFTSMAHSASGVPDDVALNQVMVVFGDAATTRRVIDELQREGTCWCGVTQWHGRTAMRISVGSWATTEVDVDASVAAMRRVAAACAAA